MLGSIIEFFKNALTEQIVKDPIWATAALIGQAVFAGRFVLQWLVSEYKKMSHIPVAFWYMSLVGSLIMFAYSIHINNLIFMLAFSLNILIYLRNLRLIHLHAKSIASNEEMED